MNEQKNIALGIAILVVIVALLVGILVLPQRGPFSRTFNINQSQQRRVLLLYHTDHQALLKAGRQVLSQGPKDPMNYRYYGPQHIEGFPVPMGVRIPKVIRKLRPHASLISRNGYVVLQMQGGMTDFGVRIYPEGFKGYRYYFTSGNRELLPGLEYYDYKYNRIPEYDKIIDEIIKNGKWEEPNQTDLGQNAN
ncbi:MAG TPA: hypothetical protein VMW72_14420 [Sedimentisphaerales bacterium]|nr:hypothetical protein [Sedimentisphaerales bacterium]